MKKILLIIGFVLGFVSAAHWDGGRAFVQEVSPIYLKPLKKGVDEVVSGIEKTGSNISVKVKNELKEKIAQ